MRIKYLNASISMTVKELLRNRMAVILFFIIPTLFYLLIVLTTTGRLISFKLSAISESTFIQVSEHNESLIFIGMASVCLITSFISLNLLQKNWEVNRRLMLCGYKPAEIIFSKLIVLVTLTLLIAVYVGLLILLFFIPKNITATIAGYLSGGFVYGCYGLLIGSIFKRDLEGILFIVLLVNIDPGWLQNPVYYTGAQNAVIIKNLPAYFPSQVSMISAFSNFSIFNPIIGSLVYGLIFLTAALIIFNVRMKI